MPGLRDDWVDENLFAFSKVQKILSNSDNASTLIFTITAEILARSLANFYRQYADRKMNLKFMRRVSERERAIRPFVIVKNKLMSVLNESVLLLTMNLVITYIVKAVCGYIASWIHSYFDNVMTKFMINNRTDAWRTDVTLLNFGLRLAGLFSQQY